MKINLSVFSMGVFLAATINPIHAQGTPDGMPPANEGICDELVGATPGLYGLCVAYCEAIDAPEDLSNPDALSQLKPPSRKILANYNRKKSDTDPEMPCVNYGPSVECPAWDDEQLAMVGTQGWSDFHNDQTFYGNGFVRFQDIEQDFTDAGTLVSNLYAATFDFGDYAWLVYYLNAPGYPYVRNFIALHGDGLEETLQACNQTILINNPVR